MVTYPDSGSPQGGVISPLISNVFLHYVLDQWFEQEVMPWLRNRAFLIRYADDFVIGFRGICRCLSAQDFFCCPPCIEKIKADPAGFVALLDQQIANGGIAAISKSNKMTSER